MFPWGKMTRDVKRHDVNGGGKDWGGGGVEGGGGGDKGDQGICLSGSLSLSSCKKELSQTQIPRHWFELHGPSGISQSSSSFEHDSQTKNVISFGEQALSLCTSYYSC